MLVRTILTITGTICKAAFKYVHEWSVNKKTGELMANARFIASY